MRYLRSILPVVCLVALSIFRPQLVVAQTPVEAKCGDSLEGEFIKPEDVHLYTIELPALATIQVTGKAAGQTLTFALAVTDKFGNDMGQTNWSAEPQVKTPVLSASGTYNLKVTNRSSQVGLFRLYFDCTGVKVTMQSPEPKGTSSPPNSTPSPTPTPRFIGAGFPGLPPVSFDGTDPVPLELGKPEQAVINARNSDLVTFSFEGNADDVLDLKFERKAGNLNLGLVVLSSDNKVAFQSSLVSSTTLSTQLVLPSAGKYSIGIFKVDLVPPTKPVATKFVITATLNAK